MQGQDCFLLCKTTSMVRPRQMRNKQHDGLSPWGCMDTSRLGRMCSNTMLIHVVRATFPRLRIRLWYWTSILLLCNTIASGQEHKLFNVAFSEKMFVGVHRQDALASIQVWAQNVLDSRSIDMSVNVSFFGDVVAARKLLDKEAVDLLWISSPEYFELRRFGGVGPSFLALKGGDPFQTYLVLRRGTPGQQNFFDLRGSTVSVQSGFLGSMIVPWLEGYLAEHGQPVVNDFFSTVQLADKVSRPVMDVFFNMQDACIVTEDGFRTMVKMNPQVGQALIEVQASPPLVPALLTFRSNFDYKVREKLVEALLDLHTSPSGQQVLLVFHIDQIVPDDGSALLETGNFYERSRASQYGDWLSDEDEIIESSETESELQLLTEQARER